MPLALTSRRGDCLNALFDVNGIQKASRSSDFAATAYERDDVVVAAADRLPSESRSLLRNMAAVTPNVPGCM